MSKVNNGENRTLLIHDLPSLDNWQIPESWLVVDARAKAAPCQGCFGCWLKTPGTCVLKDGLRHLGAAIAQSRELILASRCCYGGFSPEVKRAVDRSISDSLPFFTYRGGKLHHILRYHRAPALTVCFYGPMTDFERETAERMAQANQANMGNPTLRLLFPLFALLHTVELVMMDQSGTLTPLAALNCYSGSLFDLFFCAGLIWGLALMGRRVRKGICGVNRYTRVLMPSFIFLIGADIFMLISALFHGTLPHKLFRKE